MASYGTAKVPGMSPLNLWLQCLFIYLFFNTEIISIDKIKFGHYTAPASTDSSKSEKNGT